tara:strand:+ start:35 stop:157 length:123 start_codon:yes stop_codon:yes gene_type:complete
MNDFEIKEMSKKLYELAEQVDGLHDVIEAILDIMSPDEEK